MIRSSSQSRPLRHWSKHFETLFSANRTVQVLAVLCIPQLPTKVELDKPPTLKETIKAIDELKPCKAAGFNSIPPEIWKYGGPTLNSKLCELLVSCWEQGKLPQDLHDAVINTLYENKGDWLFLPGFCSTGSYQPLPKKISQKPVGLQSKQGHNEHGARPLAVLQTKQRTVCNVCRPHKALTPSAGKVSG